MKFLSFILVFVFSVQVQAGVCQWNPIRAVKRIANTPDVKEQRRDIRALETRLYRTADGRGPANFQEAYGQEMGPNLQNLIDTNAAFRAKWNSLSAEDRSKLAIDMMALRRYTRHGDGMVNSCARLSQERCDSAINEFFRQLPPGHGISPEAMTRLKSTYVHTLTSSIDRSLDALPSLNGGTVERFQVMDRQDLERMFGVKSFAELRGSNATMQDPGFTSTRQVDEFRSTGSRVEMGVDLRDIVYGAEKTGGSFPVQMRMTTKDGSACRDISTLSIFQGEREVLCGRNTRFRVTGVTKTDRFECEQPGQFTCTGYLLDMEEI